MVAPRTVAEVRQRARRIGYRMQQVGAIIEANGGTVPSISELVRELDFYDRAGAYRAVQRLQRRET